MDDPGRPASSGRRSPRRGLQGPRPAPLKVGNSKHSRRAKMPPLPPQRRPPVIIYTPSPKVYHANPGEFMSLVQTLTGARSGASETPAAASRAAPESAGAASSDRTGVPPTALETLPPGDEFISAALFSGFSSDYDNYVGDYLFNQDQDF